MTFVTVQVIIETSSLKFGEVPVGEKMIRGRNIGGVTQKLDER